MRRGPAFSLPSIAPEWDAVEVVRIVDPVGKAIAWFAPGLGARCLDFSARDDPASNGWRPVFSPATRDAADDSIRHGCEVTITVGRDDGHAPAVATRVPERWTMLERDPTSTLLEVVLTQPREDGADTLDLQSRLAASLDDGRLALALEAANVGSAPCLVRLGMQMTFPVGEVAFGKELESSIDLAWLRTALRREVELGEGIRDVVTRLSANRQHVTVALRSAAPAERPVPLHSGDSTRVVAVVGLGG